MDISDNCYIPVCNNPTEPVLWKLRVPIIAICLFTLGSWDWAIIKREALDPERFNTPENRILTE